MLYLDYDRQGFPYPVVPFSINCYGRRVVSQYGGASTFADLPSEEQLAREPLAGGLFACRPGARGVAEGRFGH